MTDDQREVPASAAGDIPEAGEPATSIQAEEGLHADEAGSEDTIPATAADTDEDVLEEGDLEVPAGATEGEATDGVSVAATAPAPPAGKVSPVGTAAAGPSPRVRTPARSAAAPAPTPSELAVHIDDRISAAFVLVSIAVFVLILMNGLLAGAGGTLTGPPAASPSVSAGASAAPSASASPVAS